MKRTVHIARVVVAGILFVVVLEVCARLDDYFAFCAPILGVYSNENLYENDQLGQRGRPFARYRKFQLNEFGYRGPQFEKDTVHLVTFGSSETFGLYESDDNEYPRQLERELNAYAGKARYQVINVAYPGLTLATATLRIPEIVARTHPKIALIYPSPAFYIDTPPWHLGKGAQEKKQSVFEFRINDRLRSVGKTALPECVQTSLRRWEIRRSIGPEPVMDRVPEEAVTRFRKDLIEMITALRANSVQPILMTHATIFGAAPKQPDRAMLVAWRKFYPKLKEEGFLDLERRMNEAIRQLAMQQNVTLVDIAREIPPGQEYFADFVHFSDAGAALMAKRLAEAIEPLLRRSPYQNARGRLPHHRVGVVSR